MSRFSPRVSSNAGDVAAHTFASGLRQLERDQLAERQRIEDERAEETYQMGRAADLAALREEGIRRTDEVPQVRPGSAGTLTEGMEFGAKGSPIAMGASPEQLADALGMQVPREPKIAIRAGQFVPNVGFAAENLFEGARLPNVADNARIPDPAYQPLGETGYAQGPRPSRARKFAYGDNEYDTYADMLRAISDQARAQHPDRFTEDEDELDNTFNLKGMEFPNTPEGREAAAELAGFLRELDPDDPNVDPTLNSRLVGLRDRVNYVRDALGELRPSQQGVPEFELPIVHRAGFATKEEFQRAQRQFRIPDALDGNTTNPGTRHEVPPAGSGEPVELSDDDIARIIEEFASEHPELEGDALVDAAMEYIENGGR